jgi:hypothetical protein
MTLMTLMMLTMLTMLMTLMMLTMLTMLTMPSLPTTLDIHSNSSTSGFWMPSALVNITYIPTICDCGNKIIRISKVKLGAIL